MNTGRIIVVSAPSGAGKSTLLRMVKAEIPDLAVTISATTRVPRPGETDGKDYYFLTHQQFLKAIHANKFAEWAEVHGRLYGTYRSEIDTRIRDGATLLLELDVQGMRNIRRLYPDMVAIFIRPPNMKELEHRLVLRGVNNAKDMMTRLANAENEMAAIGEFDYCIVNDEADHAAEELIAIIRRIASS